MKTKSAPLLFAPLVLLLSGCEEEVAEADTSATGGEAAGEILGGTISDDMIPLEQLTSTSPPAESPRTNTGTGGSGPPDAGAEAEAEAPETQEAGASDEAPASDNASQSAPETPPEE